MPLAMFAELTIYLVSDSITSEILPGKYLNKFDRAPIDIQYHRVQHEMLSFWKIYRHQKESHKSSVFCFQTIFVSRKDVSA